MLHYLLQLNNAPLFGISHILFFYSPGWFISISNSDHCISMCWLNADPWEACSWQVPGRSCWWERFLVPLAATESIFETLPMFLCSHTGLDPGKSRRAGKLALKDVHPGPSRFHCLVVKQSQRWAAWIHLSGLGRKRCSVPAMCGASGPKLTWIRLFWWSLPLRRNPFPIQGSTLHFSSLL